MSITRRILLVEDAEPLAYSIAAHLRGSGFEIIVATDTMRALAELERAPEPDMLLIDIVMPKGMPNGLAMARMAKMRKRDIKIIYLSGYKDLAEVEHELDGKLFTKPLDMAALEAEIRLQLAG